MAKQTVGMLMGIYNEANRIVACLEHHLPYMDEAAIVIQKSDDGTEEVVDKYFTDRGYYTVLTHSLGEHNQMYKDANTGLNVSILHFPKMGFSEATLQDGADVLLTDWILYVDADEIFPKEELEKIHDTILTTEYDAFRFERDNYFDVHVYNDAQPGMEPQWMRIKHPKRDAQLRLSRHSLSNFIRQIHVRVRVTREDGPERLGNLDGAIYHLKTMDEQWDANRDYLPEVQLVQAMERTRHNDFIELPLIDGPAGNLVFAEAQKHIPFNIQRMFFTYGVPEGVVRGGHANKTVNEVLFCLQGSVKVGLDNGDAMKKEYFLDTPNKGVFIRHNWWVDLTEFKPDTILLCFASEVYNEEDYIRNYDKFLEEVKR